MKQIILLTLTIGILTSCVKSISSSSSSSLNQQHAAPEPNSENLLGMIKAQVNNGIINEQALFIFNEEKVSQKEVELLNIFKLSDFTGIQFLSTKEGAEKYGSEGQNGVVLITPFTDESLALKFYQALNNEVVVNTIEDLMKKGLINANPVLVVNGEPLRGKAIEERINQLGKEGVVGINLLDKKMAYQIYGIRAINGVLLIDAK